MSAPYRPPETPAPLRQQVFVIAAVLIAVQVAFRAWALDRSWFFLDDLKLLADAHSGVRVTEPHDAQFMIWGRAAAWFVESTGYGNWSGAVVLTVTSQVLASAACLWMLTTLFGARRLILVPLTAYLFTAITLPATMWWAASLNAFPLQIALFCAVGAWVNYLRTRDWRWLAVTVVAIGFGLLGYVKALVIIPLLGFIALAYFARGGPLARTRHVLRTYPAAVGTGVIIGIAYLWYYLATVPQITGSVSGSVARRLAAVMLGETLPVGLVGGPWRWDDFISPAVISDPPRLAVILTWLALVVLFLVLLRTRTRTVRAWLILVGYALASYVLLLFTRAVELGDIVGYEYRYLTDVAGVWALVLGLVLMPLRGAVESSQPRGRPLWQIRGVRWLSVAVAVAVAVSGVASSFSYIRHWQDSNFAGLYLTGAANDLDRVGATDLPNQLVPPGVMVGWSYPYNTTATLLPLVTENARFPSSSDHLRMLDEHGQLHEATLDDPISSKTGPQENCGWLLGSEPVTIPLRADVPEDDWWAQIAYLSPENTSIEVVAGDATYELPVRQGLRTRFLAVRGGYSEVTMRATDPDLAICVDQIRIGALTPGERS